jgi:sugar/nucleoside kinase (ribokinase family)
MSARSGILAGGNWIVDKLKVVDFYPQQDALANILAESEGNGGSPFNILVDLARMRAGIPLAGVGLIGRDGDGEWIQRQCATHGIDTAQLRATGEAPTSYTDVMTVKSTGRRTFFHQRGANALLDVADFDFSSTSARIFHLGYLLLLDRLDAPDAEFGTAAARVLHLASAAGLKTSLDVVSEDSQRFASLVLPALRQVDYALLNDFETERTTGVKIRRADGTIDPASLTLACRRLVDAGVREWVVVHFPEGAAAMGREGKLHTVASVALPPELIVGTVGAGDAFAAGVLYGLHENVPIKIALTYGTCAAAACLGGVGTSDAVLPLAECLALRDKFGTHPALAGK